MNIEFLGPETVKGLINEGLIRDVSDLYNLKYDDIIDLKFNIDEEDKIRSLKNKSCENILRSIEKSKENEFSNVLFGLGIRYVGKTTAKKLAKSMKSIDAIISADYDKFIEVDEIGDKIAQSLIKYFNDSENLLIIEKLKSSGLIFSYEDTNQIKSSNLKNKIFVISGKFENYSREELQKVIEENSGKVSKSLSSKTSFLLAGENMGPKKKIKAKELKISVINEKEFFDLL